MANNASCLACTKGLSLDEFCSIDRWKQLVPGCPESDTSFESIFVSSSNKPCIDIESLFPVECLHVKFDKDDEFEPFFPKISGFTRERQFEYELVVAVTPADEDTFSYQLVEVVSKKRPPYLSLAYQLGHLYSANP